MDLEFLFCHFLIIIPIIEFVLSDNASTKTNFEKECYTLDLIKLGRRKINPPTLA